MRARSRTQLRGLLVALALTSPFVSRGRSESRADEPSRPGAVDATRVLSARSVLNPAAPSLPPEIVALLQEGRFAEAEAGLVARGTKLESAAERSYNALILGIAQRLGGKLDAARTTLRSALDAAPKGPWAAKIRWELAGVELAGGKAADSEALARVEAETLLAGPRKDRLAEVYASFARKLLRPDDPVTPPDPKGAYDLFVQGRALAKGEALRAHLLYEMAQAISKAGDLPRAIQDFNLYLKEYPKGVDRDQVRYRLGEAQLAANQHLPARLTWTDLARDLEKSDTKEAAATRADALFGIARTYRIPNPPDDTSLNLGVASLRRFLAAYPSNNRAVLAAYQVGQSYLVRGKSDAALAAFTSFLKEEGYKAETDESRRDLNQLTMQATFQIGRILQGQKKFDEAIAAWKGYLTKFPNGPQSADAQRAILDTQLLIADEHRARERYAEARSAWQAFAAQNPLDSRVPSILYRVGESFVSEKAFDRAIAGWEPLLSRFPQTEPAAHAQFMTASIHETEKGDPEGAIERFRKIQVEPWKSQAAQRIAVMESRTLTVLTPRAFRSGETAHLKISTRNLEKLTLSAYRLNAESYFRKKHNTSGIESLDIGLVAPDAEWTVEVPGYARFKPIETTYDLTKLELPGVYVVKVTDEKHLQATTLVLGSDLDAIIKSSRDQLLVFAQDMKTGKGRPGARVIVAQGEEVILEAKTGPDGVLLQKWDNPRDPNAAIAYLVLDGQHVAGSGLSIPGKVAQGLSPRAYIYTDRPAYRPGQDVAIRGVVREVTDGQYVNTPKAEYKLEVTDSRGRQIVSRAVVLSDFGTFHTSLPLDPGAPVGAYRVRLYQPGKSEFSGAFEVQSYRLEPIDLSFDIKKTVVFRGETVEADLIAKYQYGAPAARRPLAVRLPDNRVIQGQTDEAGRFHVSFSTEGFAEEQALRLVAQLTQDNVGATAVVALAVRAFSISVRTTRDVYLDGESFQVSVTTTDATGQPSGQNLTAALVKLVNQSGRVTEREVSRKPVVTDAKSGIGRVSLASDDPQGGGYLVRVSGTDRFGNPVFTDRALTISGSKDENRLRLLADQQTFKVGEEARVNLHARGGAGTALLTWEADRILSYRIVSLVEGNNSVVWPVEGAQFPNFTLAAARMNANRFDTSKVDFRVERELRVSVKPSKPTVGPGEEISVEVTTTDQLDRPVSAELSLALIDRALLRIYGDRLPPIGAFFYDQTRTGAFGTESTNTFRYQPATTPVPEAVVEEAERSRLVARDQAAKVQVFDRAQAQVAFGAIALPAPAPANEPQSEGQPATPSMMAGMGGMGGGMPGGGGGRGRTAYNAAPDSPALRLEGESRAKGKDDQEGAERLGELVDGSAAGVEVLQRGARLQSDFSDQLMLGKSMARRSSSSGVNRQPRQQFAETAYWNPSVVTGSDGKARITFKAPTALSSFELTARGVTGSDSLVGQTNAGLTVRQDFFVDLKIPSVLTQGDKPRFIGRVHHLGVTGQAKLKLTIYGGNGREQVYPRTLELKGDGIDEVLFEPFEVPEGDTVRLALTGEVGTVQDDLVVEIPTRPWGIQSYASASGTTSSDATVFVGLPAGRAYENPEMLVVVSPTLQRLLIELALGSDFRILRLPASSRIFPPPSNTTIDRASDLLAASSVLSYLRSSRAASAAPEASRLTERIRGLVTELTASQGEDGGWPWVVGSSNAANKPNSDRISTARVVWALSSVEPLGLLTDANALEKASGFLTAEYGKLGPGDHETRAIVLHALSTRRKASFETANSLNRLRQSLSDSALAYLALTFVNLERAPLAGEVLGILGPRGKTEISEPGGKTRRWWGGSSASPWNRSPAETTSLVALAYALARPQGVELEQAVEWIQAHRVGMGWQPHKAKGPALAALASFYGRAQGTDDRYRLVVTVNETEVHRSEVQGSSDGVSVLVPRDALKAGDRNRVRFHIEGRGTLGFAVSMSGFTREFGPDQSAENRSFLVTQHISMPAPPELDGKTLPTGFDVAVGASYFENWAHQVGLGGRARVRIDAHRITPAGQQPWERDFLVLEDHIPAGCTLVEGSVQSTASHHEVEGNLVRFYFAPDQDPYQTYYDIYGYLPGQYRTIPPVLSSAYDPGRRHMAKDGTFDLKVLAPGEPQTDPYKPTPSELYARGKTLFDAGRLVEASRPLEELFSAYTLRDDVAKDAARMLLMIHIRQYDARKVVQYFEVVKEKAPELVITFDDLLVIGRAYRDINEHERAYLVWRGVAEASYLEDARVGEVLRQRGKALEGVTYLLDLWRECPNSAAIESDFFALSQLLARYATQAVNDPALRRQLSESGVNRSDLLLQSIRLIQSFLAQSPKNPMADEASLGLINDFLELEDFNAVVRLAGRFAKLYPKSNFLDSFQYSEALGEFHLGHYDRAVEVAKTIAAAVYKDAAGADVPSPNKWEAIYILGQIFDARRQPAEAIGYYRQVSERFTDAAEAVKSFTRKDLKLPEVTVVRPPSGPRVAGELSLVPAGGGVRVASAVRRAAPPDDKGDETRPEPRFPDTLKLGYRNIAEAEIKVYPVDLMRLYLTRRNLDEITGIDLAGITPLVEKSVKLGNGEDFADKLRKLDLGLTKEGAYLVMARGENLYASGIVLVSPLELEVLEEPGAGRVRVTVRDAATGTLVPKVQVKVIGSNNSAFLSGETDLRGVFVAEGVQGQAAAVARKGTAQYAFYRGTTPIGPPPAAPAPATAAPNQPGQGQQVGSGTDTSLDNNLKMLNSSNQMKQIQRLEQRYNSAPAEKPGAAAGGFR
ncbi:MAG: MG2 domain-containing protein [Isosphaeraceae bacterium]